jgi:hypothetical protein
MLNLSRSSMVVMVAKAKGFPLLAHCVDCAAACTAVLCAAHEENAALFFVGIDAFKEVQYCLACYSYHVAASSFHFRRK